MDMPNIIASPNHNKARQNISFYIHHINNWRAHESQMKCYSNNNKTKLNKTICISYGMYCVCSNGSIRSQRSLLLTWSPFDASPITKLFMILVSRARRPATIHWATILEPYHLATSLQVFAIRTPDDELPCLSWATITKRDRRNHHWDLDMDK